MGKITQADVVRAAIHQLSKRGGYTADYYFQPKAGTGDADDFGPKVPGEHVGATCAIGGVEQAIWQLTGEVVDPSPWGDIRERLAQQAEPELIGSETPRQKLYAGVKLDDDGDVNEIRTVEQVTFAGSRTVSRKRTLQVFDAVLTDLEKSKAKASA